MSFHKIKTPRINTDLKVFLKISEIRVIRGVLLVLLLVVPVRAERKYTLGTSLDFMGGMSNQAGQSSNFNGQGLDPFYSIYPSITLNSAGRHSTIEFRYTFAGERFQMSPVLTTTSHAFTGSFDSQIGKKARLRLSDTLNTAPDYSTINVLKGFAPTAQGFQYVFEPQLYKRSNISNSAVTGLDVDLTTKSFLTFAASGSYRHYEDAIANSSYLSDQNRIEGNLGFSHKHSKRLTWSVKYAVWQNDYENFAPTRSHSATFGLSRELSPSLNLILEAGPSFTEKWEEQKSKVGYVTSAQISKQMRTNRFSAGYSHRSGDSTGLGSATESHQGTLAFLQALGRKISINFDASAFSQSPASSNAYDYWGASGSMAFLWQLGKYWVASIGGSYMSYSGAAGSYSNYASKRVYVSLGCRLPELWRTEK